MAAITISRQLGSLGTRIGQEVAQRLGCRLVRREVIDEAARRASVPEAALAAIDDLGLLGLRPSRQAHQAYQEAVRQTMEDLIAEGDVVIVGQAAPVILGPRPDVLHVRIIAPPHIRAERIASTEEFPVTAARARVEASDGARRIYLRRHHRTDWHDPRLYDLTLNPGRLDVESARDPICQAAAGAPDSRRDG